MKKLVIYIDIDGVLCSDLHEHFRQSINRERRDGVKFINWMFDQGHEIVMYTSRGVREGDDSSFDETKEMLKAWGVKYTKLERKPFFDLLVEDKAVNSLDTLKKMFEKFNGEKFYD